MDVHCLVNFDSPHSLPKLWFMDVHCLVTLDSPHSLPKLWFMDVHCLVTLDSPFSSKIVVYGRTLSRDSRLPILFQNCGLWTLSRDFRLPILFQNCGLCMDTVSLISTPHSLPKLWFIDVHCLVTLDSPPFSSKIVVYGRTLFRESRLPPFSSKIVVYGRTLSCDSRLPILFQNCGLWTYTVS